MGLKTFSPSAQSGCFKREPDIAIGSLKTGHRDLQTHETLRGGRGMYARRVNEPFTDMR